MVLGATAEAGLRRFYWTSEAQSYEYSYREAQADCFERAAAQAFPYAYGTCVQKIGSYACDQAQVRHEYQSFTGQPGLYSCRIRVWVDAFEHR